MKSARRKTSNQLLFKIIVIGQSATGKSCLMVRYIKDDFNPEYSVTVGVEFASKVVKIDEIYSIKLQIWDTAGQESFRSIVRNFYRNTSAVFLVYNILKKTTFEALGSWLKQARENSPKNVMYVLVGTHLDCAEADPSLREVSREDAETWQKQQNLDLYFETSSKSNINVAKAFEETGNQLFLNYIKTRSNSTARTEVAEVEKKKLTDTSEVKTEKKCCN